MSDLYHGQTHTVVRDNINRNSDGAPEILPGLSWESRNRRSARLSKGTKPTFTTRSTTDDCLRRKEFNGSYKEKDSLIMSPRSQGVSQ